MQELSPSSTHTLPEKNRQWVLMLFAVLILLGVFFLYAGSKKNRLVEREKALREQEDSLRESSHWPMDVSALQQQLTEAEAVLKGDDGNGGLLKQSEEFHQRATEYFRRRICEAFNSPKEFMTTATRLYYKDLYDRVASECMASKITLSPEYSRLQDDVGTTPVYQQIAKLWTIQRVIRLVLNNHLTVCHTTQNQACIISGGARAFTLTEDADAKPLLLEFPMHIVLRGTYAQFLEFLNDTQNAQNFLPVKHVMIHSVPPEAPGNSVTTLEYMVTLSAFFPLD